MKKISLALVLSGVLSVATADILSFSAGAGYWQENISGYIKSGNVINYFQNKQAETDGNNNTGNFGLRDKNNPYLWIKLIHPVPVIPNIKLQYTKYDSTGYSSYISAGDISFGDDKIDVSLNNATTTQKINSYDLTLFYQFNPSFADIEVGLGVDLWQGKTKIYGTGNGETKTWVDESWTVPLPYLYGGIETMKFYGFSFNANVKLAKISDAHHYDCQGSLKYTIDILGPVNPFLKVGYRYKELSAEDKDDKMVLKYKGAFLEIGAKF